jgi:hypothetical protein
MDVFQAISYAAGQGQVIDTDTLSREALNLAKRFQECFGNQFCLFR